MITQKELKQLLHYNPDTGIFTWKVNSAYNVKVNSIAGTIDPRKYIIIRINKKSYKAHRLAWLYVYGEFPSNHIDHINHNGIDNRIENLRVVSHQENQKNKSKAKNNTSGHVGVCWHKQTNKWNAQISVNKKNINLGYFTDIAEAISIRKQAEINYGFHKNHGE